MSFTRMKTRAKRALADCTAGQDVVVVDSVRTIVNQVSGIDYSSTTIAKLLKGIGFERVPETNGATYRRVAPGHV